MLLQVLLAALNKVLMWVLYFGNDFLDEPKASEYKKKWIYRSCNSTSERYWIDVVVDILTIALFVTATWLVFNILTTGTPATGPSTALLPV